jgi:exodeoxyribonuclease V gamma subunit
MRLIRSNRTEDLADALASFVREEPLGPFVKEAIVVQSRGMERWLTLALAERLGIWSNPAFPYPRKLIEELLDDLSEGSAEKAKAYAPSRLKWTIAELLRESAPNELEAYLGNPAAPDRVLRLAASVASVFDTYVVYRSQWLARWAEGEGTGWEPELWRRIADRLGPHDLASRIGRALATLQAGPPTATLRLERLHLFSLETLPPLFLKFFEVLSKTVPTVLYALEPSSAYMSDVDPDAVSDGHPLVATLGRLSRDFQQLLASVDGADERDGDRFYAPPRDSLLHSLQADILEFRDPPMPDGRSTISPEDRSVSIHACTGTMREVQVLHDLLCSALDEDPELAPEDIVVMTSDIDAYAPAFRAVFGQGGRHSIPFEVHDRKSRDDAAYYDDFLAVLEVVDSRFSVLDLVRLMDASSLREDFQFTSDERARLTELLSAAGIRWGIDGEHRAQLDFPAEPVHTWRAGLRRLFLGFASMPDTTEVFDGLLPRGAASLADAALVARLARLCGVLFDFHARTRRPLSVRDWVDALGQLVGELFTEEEEASPAARTLRAALGSLQDTAHHAGYEDAIELKTLRRELRELVVGETPAVGFLRRGVTLTELVPLRSVPFAVVCLVGMGEESFPRPDVRPSFDRMRAKHQLGDRNKRDEDRHSFLQAILCARDRLIVMYSASANTLRAGANPSPVVWELCETARRYYQHLDGDPLLETTSHPLHAFDAGYFDGGELPQSASGRYLEIARAIAEPSVQPGRIELRAEAEEDSDDHALAVGELTGWLWDPMATFVARVLRANFGRSELYEPTHALTTLGPLEASIVGNGALKVGLEAEELRAYLDAAPEFPDGSWGTLERRRLTNELHAIREATERARRTDEETSELVAVPLEDMTLEGRLDGLCPDRRVLARFTKAGRRAELTTWVEHLLMQAAGLASSTQLVLRESETRASLVSFTPVTDPRGALQDLVELYRTCQTKPLPLLPRVSRTYADSLDGDTDKAIGASSKELKRQREWHPHLDYVFGPDDPFDDFEWREEFQRAAVRVYGPLLEHRREL